MTLRNEPTDTGIACLGPSTVRPVRHGPLRMPS